MRLFSTKGFEATSVSQIEAAAGLSPGSGALYRHFASKEALLSLLARAYWLEASRWPVVSLLSVAGASSR
jgi:AcrR family transcriptional regulator